MQPIVLNCAFLGSVGAGEILLVFLVVLILFGPRRLPEIARTIGRIVSDLRRASQQFQDEIMRLDETPDSRGKREESASEPQDVTAVVGTQEEIKRPEPSADSRMISENNPSEMESSGAGESLAG